MRTLSLLALLTLAAPLCAQGSDNKGKFYFKKTCKACHAEGKGKVVRTCLEGESGVCRRTRLPA